MLLYLIRHADAGDPRQWAGDDAARPLSPLGQRQSLALGECFKKHGTALQAVVSSPLVRTRQTAEGVIAGASLSCEITFCDLLAPGQLRRKKLAKHLASLGAERVAIVGHDPDLPAFLGWLLGVDPEHVHLEKGGAAAVAFEDEPGKGDGTLAWMVTPEWYLNAS
jgi:phosphohistidine phosphatase